MEKKYILNRETGKIELHFEKSEYQEMPEDKKRILRSNYLFSRKAEAWVSRAKYPNLYSAKRAAEQLGFTEGEKVGERLNNCSVRRIGPKQEQTAIWVMRRMPSDGVLNCKRNLTNAGEILLSLRNRLSRDTPARRALQNDAEESTSDTIRAWKNIVKASISKSVRKSRKRLPKMPS